MKRIFLISAALLSTVLGARNCLAAIPGAVCDGVTDDGAKVNAALAAAAAGTDVDMSNCNFTTTVQISIPANVGLYIGNVNSKVQPTSGFNGVSTVLLHNPSRL
jgi:hypothetical protein